MLAHLNKRGADCQVNLDEAAPCAQVLPRVNVDPVLRLQLKQSSIDDIKWLVSSEVDVDALRGPSLNSVMFDGANGSIMREFHRLGLLGESSIWQSFSSTSQFGQTGYSISNLELIGRRRADEPAGANLCGGGTEPTPSPCGPEAQPLFGTGRTTYYISD